MDILSLPANSREKKIHKWLERVPEGLVALVLLGYGAEEPELLNSWSANHVSQSCVEEICETIDSYSEAQGSPQRTKLEMKIEGGVVTRTLVLAPKREASEMVADTLQPNKLDGSRESQTTQLQRFAENSHQMVIRSSASFLSQASHLLETAGKQQERWMREAVEMGVENKALRKENEELREELGALNAVVAALEAAAADGAPANSPGIEKLVETVAPFLPHIAGKLVALLAAPSAPPAATA